MITTIYEKNNSILYADHTGKKNNELTLSLKETNKVIKESGINKLIANFTDTHADQSMMDYLHSKESVEINKNLKCAVLGIDGFRRMFVNSYNMIMRKNVKLCNNLEEAKEYLLSV
jgi:hypothetical protein